MIIRTELIANICQDLLERFVELSKKLYFRQIALFIVFFIVIWARNIWSMIDLVCAVQGFPSQL